MKKLTYLAGILSLLPLSAQAFNWGEWYSDLKENIADTWSCGRLEAYAPFYAWHNRLAYDKEHIDKYNEEAWGFGLGKGLWQGNEWHGLYAFAFKDSNFYLETFAGYAYQYNWALDDSGDFKIGAGYTLGITQRHEYSYIPVPLPLPVGGISYKNLAWQAAYVPGIKNDGNVLFTWLKFTF
ncbi:MAG: lipid IV(A) palmitoyltransferase PagP [Alphaproteobacteria bacterium]|nr:lipid IV(A) palmitoyltransferase PagP [Alphaproteobacteria bacterium]